MFIAWSLFVFPYSSLHQHFCPERLCLCRYCWKQPLSWWSSKFSSTVGLKMRCMENLLFSTSIFPIKITKARAFFCHWWPRLRRSARKEKIFVIHKTIAGSGKKIDPPVNPRRVFKSWSEGRTSLSTLDFHGHSRNISSKALAMFYCHHRSILTQPPWSEKACLTYQS